MTHVKDILIVTTDTSVMQANESLKLVLANTAHPMKPVAEKAIAFLAMLMLTSDTESSMPLWRAIQQTLF